MADSRSWISRSLRHKNLRTISSLAELSARLGDRFVLLTGSAISGVVWPHLGMVGAVRDGIMSSLARTAAPRCYVDELYRAYALSLATPGSSYKNLLDSTKFETFLGMVSDSSSRDALNNLLDQLYTCKPGEPGPNHKAIAALLQSGKCQTCLTTNFDNCIELACQEAGVKYDLTDEPGKYPDTLPGRGARPVIIKLHGSSVKGNCVADSSGLWTAQTKDTHGPLKRLLAGCCVLVLGYSGLGDIDISPQLTETEATFFWANHQHPGSEVLPDWADYFVLTNLQYPEKGSAPNLLLDLAETKVRRGTLFRNHEAVDRIIARWTAGTHLDANRLVMSVFAWRRTQPVLHLQHEEYADSAIDPDRAKYGAACAQTRVYRSGFAILKAALTNGGLSQTERYRAQQSMGFALWRMARWEEARGLFEGLMDGAPRDLSFDDSANTSLLAAIYRTYLELCRDMLQIVPWRQRNEVAKGWRLEEALQMLRKVDHQSPENQILAQFVERNIAWLLGEAVSVEEITELYERCISFETYNSASAVLTLLFQMSRARGWRRMGPLNRKFREAGVKHYITKNRESWALSMLSPIFLPLGEFGHSALRRCFRVSYGFKVWLEERRYRKQLQRWARLKERWLAIGKIDLSDL